MLDTGRRINSNGDTGRGIKDNFNGAITDVSHALVIFEILYRGYLKNQYMQG